MPRRVEGDEAQIRCQDIKRTRSALYVDMYVINFLSTWYVFIHSSHVEDRVVDTYRRSRTRMRERTRHRSGNTQSRVANGVTRHRRR